MKKTLTIILLIFGNTFCVLGQPSIQWSKNFGGGGGDLPWSMQQTIDGGYVLAGESSSNDGDVTGNHGLSDYWILKLDYAGNIQWQKSLGGTSNDWAYSIQQTSDGGYVVAGASASYNGDVSGNHGDFDYWIVKLDSTGNLQWQKCLGGTGFDRAYAVKQTTDGGYIVAGQTTSTNGDVTGNNGDYDYWIAKLNSSGNLQWQKCLGGSGYDRAFSVQQISGSCFIVAGFSHSTDSDVTGNHGGEDYWIVKLDSAGSILWEKSLGGTSSEGAYSIQPTSDAGYVIAGFSYSTNGNVTGNHGGEDYWIVKLDSSGILQWQKSFGGLFDESAYSIQQTIDGGYIVAGDATSNDSNVTGNHGDHEYWLVKLNSSGTRQWQKCFGGTGFDAAYSILQTADGCFVVSGASKSTNGDVPGNHGNGLNDYWVVRLDDGTDAQGVNYFFSNFRITPNPMSLSTVISFSLYQSENLSVNVYDLTGRLVKNLFAGKLNAGAHELKWNVAENGVIDDGIYLVNIVGDTFSHSSKLVIVK